MTGLDDVVLAALPILVELSEKQTTRENAQQQLTTAAAKGGLRVRLIEDEESYDGSVHHDVIIRGPGHPTVSMSVASGPGLPWPLRGVERSREFDLVQVNGETTSVADAVACLDGMFEDVRLLRAIVDSSLVGQAFVEFGLDMSAEEVQQAADAYRRGRRLYSAEATTAWLRANGLTPTLLTKLIQQYATVAKVRRHAVGASADRWFAEHHADLDVLVVAWATGGLEVEARLQTDPVAAIAAAWRDGGTAGLEQWCAADLPAGFSGLRSAAVGDVAAIEHDGTAGAALVIDRRTAEPDVPTMDAVERRLFDDWLAQRRASARVTWFWGDRRHTDRVNDVAH